jgi:hypothetical protein
VATAILLLSSLSARALARVMHSRRCVTEVDGELSGSTFKLDAFAQSSANLVQEAAAAESSRIALPSATIWRSLSRLMYADVAGLGVVLASSREDVWLGLDSFEKSIVVLVSDKLLGVCM